MLELILDYLNREQRRATYGAVAEVLGIPARSVGQRLGERNMRASWVVSAETGRPSRYQSEQVHPDLMRHAAVITSGAELRRRISGLPAPPCTCGTTPGICRRHAP